MHVQVLTVLSIKIGTHAKTPFFTHSKTPLSRSCCWSDTYFNAFRLRKREREVIGTPNLKFRSFAPFQIPIGNIIIILVRDRRDRERKYKARKGGSSERTCCQNETKFCFKTFVFVLLMLCIVYELWRVFCLAFWEKEQTEEIWAESQDAKRFDAVVHKTE